MGRSAAWKPRLEVIIDLGKFGDTRAIRGGSVAHVCAEAEAYMRMVIEAELPFYLKVSAPHPEHDQIRDHLDEFASSLGKPGYPSLEAMQAGG